MTDLNGSREIRLIVDGEDADDARALGALAVFPTLPADVRAEIGECP